MMRAAVSSVRREVALVVGVSLLAQAPFWGKPLHIDDNFTIYVARQILETPFRPLSTEQNFGWVGAPSSLFAASLNPPGIAYVAAPLVAMLERPELALQITFSLFAALLGLATWSLADTLGGEPRRAGLLVVVMPMVVLMGASIMPDLPAAALLAACLALTARASAGSVPILTTGVLPASSRRVAILLAGGGCAAAAIFCKYTAVPYLLLVPLLAWRFRARWTVPAIVLAPPVLGLSLWCLHNLWLYGDVHLLASGRLMRSMQLSRLPMATHYLSMLGGTTLMPLLLVLWVARSRAWVVIGGAAAATVYLMLQMTRPVAAAPNAVLLALLLFLGSAFLGIGAVRALRGDGTDRLLLAWLLLNVTVCVYWVYFGAARYLLYAAPAVAIAVSRQAVLPERWRQGGIAVSATLLFSWLVASADRQHAEVLQTTAFDLLGVPADRRVAPAFAGEWGFRYYGELQGAQYYVDPKDGGPTPPSSVVVCSNCGAKPIHFLPSLQGLEEVEPPSARLPLQLTSKACGAGFYAHHFGLLPYAWCDAPIDTFLRAAPRPDHPAVP